MKKSLFSLLLILVLFTSCKSKTEELFDLFSYETYYAREFLYDIAGHQYNKAFAELDPEFVDEFTPEKFKELYEEFSSEKMIDMKLAGMNVSAWDEDNSRLFFIYYECEYENSEWLLAEVAVQEKNFKYTIKGIHFYNMEKSFKDAYKFTFKGKGSKHNFIFFLFLLMPLFSLYTLFVCIRTPMKKGKILWILFILLGFTSTTINWASGEVVFKIFRVTLLSFFAKKAWEYEPWFFSFSIPVGAIVFWIYLLIRRKKTCQAPDIDV